MTDETSSGTGLVDLIKILKKHAKSVCEKDESKAFITVGVVGQPNTGKQTLINTLKKERVKVEAENSSSKRNEIILHRQIKLLSNKGLIFPPVD